MKIDYIVPYVDNTDVNWQKLYQQYSNSFKYDANEFERRFQQNILFKYVFRGIEKYMPWINNVFLIVQSKTQIPAWINTKFVKIVYHKDFIPTEYLPTFNSNVIECFLHNIDSLSEFFIYGNDDQYILNKCDEDDFFISNFPRNNIHLVKSENDYYSEKMFLMNKIIDNDLKLQHNAEKYYTAYHIQQPYSKTIYKDIFKHFEKQITESLSRFRNEKSLSQFLFSMYFVRKTNEKYVYNNISHKYFNTSISIRKAYQYLEKPIDKLVCLNNGNELTDMLLDQQLKKIFKLKSKYEQ